MPVLRHLQSPVKYISKIPARFHRKLPSHINLNLKHDKQTDGKQQIPHCQFEKFNRNDWRRLFHLPAHPAQQQMRSQKRQHRRQDSPRRIPQPQLYDIDQNADKKRKKANMIQLLEDHCAAKTPASEITGQQQNRQT